MFINAELEICPAFGWSGGPSFSSRIITLQSWEERRNANNAECRHNYSLPVSNIEDEKYITQLKQVFMACRGQLHSFKIKDREDYQASNEPFMEGDGVETVFQLQKVSTFGVASYSRIITKPESPIIVTLDNVVQSVTVDYLTGLVTFLSAPAAGKIGRWSGEFRVPVRFNSDTLNGSIDNKTAAGKFLINGSIDLIEVFGE